MSVEAIHTGETINKITFFTRSIKTNMKKIHLSALKKNALF